MPLRHPRPAQPKAADGVDRDLAIVLGVAMISGTYVLTDSIDQAFDRIFTDIRQGSNVVISGKSAFDLTEGSGVT